MEKIILTEDFFGEDLKLNHSVEKKGNNYYIIGEHALLEEPNENKRIYRKKIFEREIKKLKDARVFERRGLIARLEHPKNPEELPPSFTNGCAAFLDMWIETKNSKCFLYAKSIILDENFYGKELLGLIKKRVKPGASTRGVGSLKLYDEEKQIYEVDEDYQFFTIDYVSNPSGGVFPEAITESKTNQKKVYLSVSDELIRILERTKNK